MGGTSFRWLVAAVMMLCGAVVHAGAVSLVWRPCATEMLNGSVLIGYHFYRQFSDACALAMDTGPVYPLPEPGVASVAGYLAVVAALLFALSWLVVLPALKIAWWAGVLAAAPAVLILVMLVQLVVLSLDSGAVGAPYPTPWLPFVAELAVLVALVVLAASRVPGALLLRAGLVAVTATAPGLFHQFGVYFFSIMASEANWDRPPGTGCVVSTLSIAAAVVVLVLWWADRTASCAAPSA